MYVAWQKQIRDRKAQSDASANLFGAWWEGINTSLENAEVKEISYDAAKSLIVEYEWLGNMGTTEYAYGLLWDGCLGGVACFGRTAGTGVYASVAGDEFAGKAITLCRGACTHWAHPHAASFLINRACTMLNERYGYQIIIAYSDPEAGEVGTVYQASNWLYCGMTAPTEKFDVGDGKVRDARLVSAYTRDRRGGTLKYKRTRAEQKKLMLEAGVRFFKGTAKHRYVKLLGSHKERKTIRKVFGWPVLPYPKRATEVSREIRPGTTGEGAGRFCVVAPNS